MSRLCTEEKKQKVKYCKVKEVEPLPGAYFLGFDLNMFFTRLRFGLLGTVCFLGSKYTSKNKVSNEKNAPSCLGYIGDDIPHS